MAITVEEYLLEHGTNIGIVLKESVREMDYSIALGEIVQYALPVTFAMEGTSHSGVAAVTSHRFICCSSVSGNLVNVSMPFSQAVGIGGISGLLLKQMPITCESVTVIVMASSKHIAKLQHELLAAIESAPNQKPLTFGGVAVLTRSQKEDRKIQQIKKSHQGERRLSKTECKLYGKCPQCKKAILVEKAGVISCLSCGHKFEPKT